MDGNNCGCRIVLLRARLPAASLVLHAAVCAGTGASAYLHNCPCLVVTVARIDAAPLPRDSETQSGRGQKGA